METNNLNNIAEIARLFQIQRVLLLFVGFSALVMIVKFIDRLVSNLSERFPAKRILFLQVVTVVNFSIYIFGGSIMFYAIIRPPKELMLAVGGSAAVAIGFSLKDLVSSLVAGIMLLFDRPFQVGDRVSFGEYYGEIKSIGLRAVRLQTLDDNLVTIPNSRFITDAVASANAGALDMMVVIPFHVALDADLDLARDIVYETVTTSRFIYLKKPASIVLSEVAVAGRLAIRISAKAYVLDAVYEKAFQTEVTDRVTALFAEHHIKRPVLSLEKIDAFGGAKNEIEPK